MASPTFIKVQFEYGNQAAYDSLATKDNNVTYWITDANNGGTNLYKGETLFATTVTASNESNGLLSSSDYAFIREIEKAIEEGLVTVITSPNSTIDISTNTIKNIAYTTIDINTTTLASLAGDLIDTSENDNILTSTGNGLYVPATVVDETLTLGSNS